MSSLPSLWEGEVWIHAPNGIASRYERYCVTLNPDGSRTLRTLTVSPNGSLVRDVHQSVSQRWEPLHGSSRVFLNGTPQGVVSKWVGANGIHSSVFVDQHYSQETFSRPAGKFSIGFHPIADESWKMALIDCVTGTRSPLTTHTASPTWNGKTIEHGRTVTSEVEFVGFETRRIGDLAHECRCFIWYTPFQKELKIWAFGDHYLFAGLHVLKGDNAGTEYVVRNLQRSDWA